MPIASAMKAQKINSSINVTPMVDVMLVLLIIFMVVTPMLQNDPRVKMATTQNPIAMPDADRTDALVVSVMHDGKIFFNTQAVTGEELTQTVKDRLAVGTNKTVFVRADARVRYGILANAVDDVRSAGVDQLGLLTEKKLR